MDEIKPGEEVGVIEAWRSYHDEIEELKKVFFEFLKRWVDIDTSTVSDVNKPVLCRRLRSLGGQKAEPFRLSDSLTFKGTNRVKMRELQKKEIYLYLYFSLISSLHKLP